MAMENKEKETDVEVVNLHLDIYKQQGDRAVKEVEGEQLLLPSNSY